MICPMCGTPTPARTGDPVTSHRAALSVDLVNAKLIHRWILDRLTGTDGLTHEEIAGLYIPANAVGYAPDSSPSGLRTRMSELVRGGMVKDSGRTRRMVTGRQAIVWVQADNVQGRLL